MVTPNFSIFFSLGKLNFITNFNPSFLKDCLFISIVCVLKKCVETNGIITMHNCASIKCSLCAQLPFNDRA